MDAYCKYPWWTTSSRVFVSLIVRRRGRAVKDIDIKTNQFFHSKTSTFISPQWAESNDIVTNLLWCIFFFSKYTFFHSRLCGMNPQAVSTSSSSIVKSSQASKSCRVSSFFPFWIGVDFKSDGPISLVHYLPIFSSLPTCTVRGFCSSNSGQSIYSSG